MKPYILTKSDREFRKVAQTTLKNKIASIKGLPNSKFLIHHEDEQESTNDLDNFTLIKYKDNVNIAHAVHKYIHTLNSLNNSTTNVKVFKIENDVATPYKVTLSIEQGS